MVHADPALANDAAGFYQSRRTLHRTEVTGRRHQHVQLSYVRLLWALLFLGLAWLVWGRHVLPWPWLLLPWMGFATTAFFHSRVIAAEARSRRSLAWCEHGLARIEDRWAGLRPRTTRVDSSGSLFAADLDLFSLAGLFELLCTARTTAGEDLLASWLLAPAPLEMLRRRQACVAALASHTHLREAIAGISGPDVIPLESEPLLRWAEGALPALPTALRWLAPLLAGLTVAAAAYWALTHSSLALVAVLLVDAAVHFYWQHRLRPVFASAQTAGAQLLPISDLLAALEQASFADETTSELQRRLSGANQSASSAIRHLARLAAAIEQRGAVRLLDIPFLLSLQLGSAVERWRNTHGARLRSWLDVLAEFEALLSLSAYRFEHGADPFPEIVDGPPMLLATGLGHPLLSRSLCVRNDLMLDPRTRLLLVSGSNMSGKSTLLRSVGVATVMAMAGAPVRAHAFRLTPLQIAASIQVNDSLQAGHSRFYAEILRLRAVCETARMRPPALFLLDELLAGTNSHDRQAGANGIIEALLASGAVGLLSTHDLALTAAHGPHASLIRNAHFEDTITEDRIAFDYKLRDGVVERSNGLALMRLVGLDV